MNYKPYKHLPPFKGMVLQNFPFIEEDFDAITNYQLLCKVVEYLKNVIDNELIMEENVTNLYNSFVELKNYVDNYFDNLDVQEEINNKLDSMALDGTLENIIGNVLNKINGSLTLSVAYRDCDEYISGITDETVNAVKGYSQGFTTTPTSFLIIRQYGGSSQGTSDICYLEEISKSTLETLRSTKLQLFHGNSIAYNHLANEIYVAPLYAISGGESVSNNTIIVVDYNTFTIKDTITLPSEITDATNIYSVSYDNKNKVLAVGGKEHVFILDDFETINTHIVLNYSNTAPLTNIALNKSTYQNFVLYDNIIYVTRLNASGITLFDLNGNLIKNYYDFDIETPINIGELEALSIEENGNIYLSTHRASGSSNGQYDIKDIIIFKSNLNYNGYKNYERIVSDLRVTSVYVDSETTNKYQLGTQTLPFKSITQAIYYSQYFDNDNSLTVNLVGSNKNFSYIISGNNNHITINGNNNLIYGMELDRQNGMRLYNVKVNCSALRNINTETYPTNNRIIRSTNIIFDNVQFLNDSGSNFDYGIMINNSRNIYIKNITINNFNNGILLQDMSEIFLKTYSVNNVTYYYYTGDNNIINGLSNASLNRINPNSTDIPQFNVMQYVTHTFNNETNVLELTNKHIETSTSGRAFFVVSCTLKLDGTNFTFNFLLNRNEIQSFNFINSNKSAMYDIAIAVSHTTYSSIWTFTPRVIKTTISNNTLSDISDSVEMNINNIRLLN